jgi:ADP-ribose pyrophosphatase YjhB (NUDIX family)
LEDAAKRILKMKVPHSFSPSYTEQLLDVGNETRDSRGWSKTTPYLCLFQTSETADFNADEDFKWVSLVEIFDRSITLPFDHSDLIKNAYDSLITKSRYSSVLFYLLENDFVVKDIIDCFASFGYRISKQTIMKRWVDKELMLPTGNKRRNENGGKPAFVYNLSSNELNYFEFSLAMK